VCLSFVLRELTRGLLCIFFRLRALDFSPGSEAFLISPKLCFLWLAAFPLCRIFRPSLHSLPKPTAFELVFQGGKRPPPVFPSPVLRRSSLSSYSDLAFVPVPSRALSRSEAPLYLAFDLKPPPLCDRYSHDDLAPRKFTSGNAQFLWHVAFRAAPRPVSFRTSPVPPPRERGSLTPSL